MESTMTLNLPKAQTGLESFYSPVSAPGEGTDVMAPFVLQRQKMKWCREQVVETDIHHQVAVGKLLKFIKRRDSLTSSLGGKLVDVRRICLGLLEEDEFSEVGLDGAVSQDPVTVLRQGRKVRLAFGQPGLELTSPSWVKAKIEVDWMLDDLVENVDALDAMIDQVAMQNRIVQAAAAARRQAVEDFDENHLLVGRSVEACFRMAGMKEEADRVRMASRRPSRSEEEPVLEAGPAEEPPAPPDGEAGIEPAASADALSADAASAEVTATEEPLERSLGASTEAATA